MVIKLNINELKIWCLLLLGYFIVGLYPNVFLNFQSYDMALYSIFCTKINLVKNINCRCIIKRYKGTITKNSEHVNKNTLCIESLPGTPGTYIIEKRYDNFTKCNDVTSSCKEENCINYCKLLVLPDDLKRKIKIHAINLRIQPLIIKVYGQLYLDSFKLTEYNQLLTHKHITRAKQTFDYYIMHQFFVKKITEKEMFMPYFFKHEQIMIRYMMIQIAQGIINEKKNDLIIKSNMSDEQQKIYIAFMKGGSQVDFDKIKKKFINDMKDTIRIKLIKDYKEEFKDNDFNRNLLQLDHQNDFNKYLLKKCGVEYDKKKNTLNFNEFIYLFYEDNNFRYNIVLNDYRGQLESYVNEIALWICYINIISEKARKKHMELQKKWDEIRFKIDFDINIPFNYANAYSKTTHFNLLKLINYVNLSFFEHYFLDRDATILAHYLKTDNVLDGEIEN